jgi:uracil phosphoribosyltransferase
MIREYSKKSSILNQFVAELRDRDIQQDRMRFRRNLERCGEIMAYELSKELNYSEKEILSPLGEVNIGLPDEYPVLATILRAGLPLHQGFLNYFDKAENAFVSAYRRYHKGGDFEIEVEYASCPSLEDKILVIIDPMLATGASIEMVYKALLRRGKPKQVHIAAVIAGKQGIAHVQHKLPQGTVIHTCAIDPELTSQAFIVPGLGDAGDLAFGEK